MDTAITQEVIKKLGEIEKDMAGKELGDEIKRLRLKSSWSQEELAKKIGLHQTRVSTLENGEHNYPLETIYRLASAFKISPFELAAIYWGIRPDQLPNREKELLNNLLSLFDDYRSNVPKLPEPQTPPQPTQYSPEELEEIAQLDAHHIKQARKNKRQQPIKNQTDLKDNDS